MKIEQLTFTRFIAAFFIVVFHFGFRSYLFNNQYVNYVFDQANIGVSYFFILSGFVMIIAYHQKNLISVSQYLKRRFFRIYPLYLFSLVLVLLMQIKTGSLHLSDFLSNLLMIQAWIPQKALTFNIPGWSLSVELVFYVLFPLLFNRLYKRFKLKQYVVFIIVFWLINQIAYNYGVKFYKKGEVLFNFLTYNPILHINQFLIGNIAGIFFVKKYKNKRSNVDLWLLLIGAILLFTLKFSLGFSFHNGLLALLFVPFIILLSINNGYITKFFKSKFCVFLGEISYGVYILQFPVFSIISAYSLKKYFNIFDETFLFLIRLFVLVILSSITYICIEKPIVNFSRKQKVLRKNKAL